jgi:tetratricopeptide (TPR) repeat protein
LDIVDFQCEVLADTLARFKEGAGNFLVGETADTIMRARRNWDWYRVPGAERALALKVNAVFAKAITDRLDKNEFSPTLLNWLKGTRRGEGWHDRDLNGDLFLRLVKEKRLPVAALMAHANWEFQIPKEYSVESYFDDMFVEEATAKNYLDIGYWDQRGKDISRKVRNVAAKIIQGYEALPLGYGDRAVVYSPADFWRWQSYAMDAEAAVRDEMLDKVGSRYGTTRFDAVARGRPYFQVKADVSTPAGRKAFFEKLAAYNDRVAQSPERSGPPTMLQITRLTGAADLSDAELDALVRMFRFDVAPAQWSRGNYFENVVPLVHQALLGKNRDKDLFALIPHFWAIAKEAGNTDFLRAMIGLCDKAMNDNKVELAAVYSTLGQDIVASLLSDVDRNSLNVVRSRALGSFGGVIPVKPNDPRYPVFAAQAEFLMGDTEKAWKHYLSAGDKIMGIYKEMDPSFCAWVIDRDTQAGRFEQANELARALIQWMDANPLNFSPETRLDLMLAYANIAFSKPEYPRAKALYSQITAAREFASMRGQVDAEIRISEIDRITGQKEEATSRIEKLLKQQSRYVQIEGNYQMARIKFFQDDHDAAREHLELVFALTPTHAEARILEGKVNLAVKRYEDAQRLKKIGLTGEQQVIVPGKPLHVTVEDKTLAVVGRTSDVQIRAWTESGDEEFFNLRPWADSRTRFEGEIGTALAPIKKGDGTLQVLGGDKIRYDYSDAFKTAHKITDSVSHSLVVISDAEFYASSGRIVSKTEQEKIDLENMIRAKLKITETADTAKKDETPLSAIRVGNQVKPGNNINIRVIDPDQSRSSSNDTVTVRLRTTSGDSIEAALLRESETHSGVFNAAIPTAPAPAAAFATDSKEGCDPSFAISSGDYPAWIALDDSKKPKMFTVDLNDNKFLGPMQIMANVPGRKLKDLVMQVSMNGKVFQTIGGWPVQNQAWNGAPLVTIVKAPPETAAQVSLAQALDEASFQQKKIIRLKTMAAKWGADVMGQAGALGLAAGDYYIVRISGAFYVPKHQVRTLRLNANAMDPEVSYSMYVDGQDVMAGGRGGSGGGGVVPKKGVKRAAPQLPQGVTEPPPIQFKGILKKGAHLVDIYITSTTAGVPSFELLADTEQPPFIAPCPADMFDPEQHPEILDGVPNWVASIQPEQEGGAFNVTFSKGTRGRAVRLIIHDYETDAPAIAKIHLKTAEGETVLPTPVDLLALRRNQILEIIPGDTISLAYEDPTGLSLTGVQRNKRYEQTLSVTYANGTIGAGLVVGYKTGPDGLQLPDLAQIYRFRTNDTIDVTVRDPDADVSEAEDTVQFTVQTFGKEPIALEAKETAAHSGVFAGRIFPIGTEPKRKSEVRVIEGDDLILSYLDRENTEPGVPWIRSTVIEQVWYQEPEVRVYEVKSQEAGTTGTGAPKGAAAAKPAQKPVPKAVAKGGKKADDAAAAAALDETIEAKYELIATRPTAPTNAGPVEAVIGGPVLMELQWPTIARSSVSKASVYVQTKAGRAAYGQPIPDGAYELKVPGTVKLTVGIGAQGAMPIPLGYRAVTVTGERDTVAASAAEAGRFMFSVPMAPGGVPKQSFAELTSEDRAALEEGVNPELVKVKGNDELYLGFKYEDASGAEKWILRTVKLMPGGVLFDVMDKDYLEGLAAVYVGDSAYYRVINPAADVSDERDTLKISLNASSGKQQTLDLTETFAHSGVFKAVVKFSYDSPGATAEVGTMPVTYGANVLAKYDPGHVKALERGIEIFKGSDGDIMPFSKRFKDPTIAIRTQLAIAEAYFELAKEHRRLKQEKLSAFEIGEGKRILEEAVADYPDTEARAQADYLLANLSMEFAEDATDAAVKEKFLREAVVRFRDIVSVHPDSPYAPKSQYKKALALEKLGDIDVACEEYVKLSYRWPDHELIAETIARLGQYFYKKGKDMADQAEKITEPVEQERVKIRARDFYTTSAEVFGRLAVRFPSHKLADKTTVLSGQCYMRAEDFGKAVRMLRKVADNLDADKNVRPEAMYWCGDSYYKMSGDVKGPSESLVEAYRMWKKLTWDYPATQWAKYARGRLAEPEMARMDQE